MNKEEAKNMGTMLLLENISNDSAMIPIGYVDNAISRFVEDIYKSPCEACKHKTEVYLESCYTCNHYYGSSFEKKSKWR